MSLDSVPPGTVAVGSSLLTVTPTAPGRFGVMSNDLGDGGHHPADPAESVTACR